MTKIGNDLIKAYIGRFEDEWETREYYQDYVKKEGRNGEVAVIDFDTWIKDYVVQLINESSPKRRLEVYLEWNGILGWTNRIWELSQGEL